MSRNPRFKTALLSVLVASQLALPATAQATSIWPEPTPRHNPHLPVMHTNGTQPTFAPISSKPNFSAPSATNCTRPPQFHEIVHADFQSQARNSERERPMGDRKRALESDAMAATGSAKAEMAVKVAPPSMSAPVPPAAAPAPAPALAGGRTADSSAYTEPASPLMPQRMPQPLPAPSRPANEPVTAGVVDDNQQFSEYLSFVRRTAPGVRHLGRDVSLRHLVEVKDSEGRAAADAEVLVHASSGLAMWARTDAAGKFWLHPNAFDSAKSPVYQITVRSTTKGSWGRSKTTEATALLQRGQKSAVEIRLPAQGTQASRAQLDLVFLIDATGSMGDEIDKLKTTLRSIADDVARLPSRPDICYGLVAYRDRTDEFVVRSHDFTNDLNAFQNVLNELRANGGGDYPEAMSEALEQSIHRLSWRGGSGQNTTRMVLLLADAPPQIGRGEIGYDETMQAALGKGIKLFSVGASGLDKQGELVQRQMAQYTGGKFVFLTYANANNPASGPGRETKHDVSNYSVDTLDQLVVRLVKEELALR